MLSLTLHHALQITLSRFYSQVSFPIGVQNKNNFIVHLYISNSMIIDVQHFPRISMGQVAIERGHSQTSYVKVWIVIGYGITTGLMTT